MRNGIYEKESGLTYILYNDKVLHVYDDIDSLIGEFVLDKDLRNDLNNKFPDDGFVEYMNERTDGFWNKRTHKKLWGNKEYKKYIKSKEWQEKRALKIEEVGFCQKCGATENLHVHHLTYENFKNEKPEDLQVLCKDCHMKVHGRKF